MLLLCAMIAGSSSVWADDQTYASWTFTSDNKPANKTNFSATGGPCTESTFYLDGTGATWHSTKGFAFTAVTSITLTLKLTSALPAGSKITFSADTYYNNKTNAPMTGFNLTASENGGDYTTTGLNVTSLSLSNSSATKTCVYTTQNALAMDNTIAIKYTQTGKAGSGQGYFNNILINGPEIVVAPTPSISADDVEIAYNATSGSIEYSLGNGSGNVEASVTTGNWLTLTKIDEEKVSFTCSANTGNTARTATVTLSFTGVDDKVVTVTQNAAPPTIALNAACTDGEKYYGTYSSSKAFVVPSDLTVSEIKLIEGKLSITNYNTGAIVPANTGVMVSSTTSGNHTITLSDEAGTSVLGANNMLKPSGDAGIDADGMATAASGCKYYRLTMHNASSNSLGEIGFWWGAESGAAFALSANKAYLAVPTGGGDAPSLLWFDNGSTGVDEVRGKTEEVRGDFFDLQGRKVANPTKGLYIVDGKKVVVK